MNKNIKSGFNRRQRHITEDWKMGKERRMILKDPDKTIGRLRMVDIFEGLSSEQLKKLLNICSKINYKKNEIIYQIKDESTDMFILIRGKLNVQLGDGGELSGIIPAGIVGAIGIITGEPHAASVIAGISCTILSFNKEELFRLFSSDTNMQIKIQSNIIKNLSDKLKEDNRTFEEKRKLRSLELQ